MIADLYMTISISVRQTGHTQVAVTNSFHFVGVMFINDAIEDGVKFVQKRDNLSICLCLSVIVPEEECICWQVS